MKCKKCRRNVGKKGKDKLCGHCYLSFDLFRTKKSLIKKFDDLLAEWADSSLPFHERSRIANVLDQLVGIYKKRGY